ncbi:MAG: DUF5808 domain-containing protein [Balneolaceae bacterium]
MVPIIIITILTVLIGFLFYDAYASQKWKQENREQETITESDHFYWRLFYYNPDDKRILVPKRTGGGYTVNFANPLSIAAGLLVIGIVLVMIFYK